MLFLSALLLVILLIGIKASKSPLKVVIAGGGPAGLLTAYALTTLSNNNLNSKKEIFIFESRDDPRISETGPRS